jgi:hypothetical protein
MAVHPGGASVKDIAMIEHDRIARSAHMLAALLLAAGLAACGERISDTRVKAPTPTKPESSAVVIGQAPAEPTGDPPGTTPVASGTTEVTKSVEDKAMPQPGQPNDHSNVAPKPSQKADEIAKTPEEGKAANDGERTK